MGTRTANTAPDQAAFHEAIGNTSYEQLQTDPATSVPEVQYSRLNPATLERQSAPPGRDASGQATSSQVTNWSRYEELQNDHGTLAGQT